MYDFLIYVILTLITPGPNTITSMTNGIRYGFRKGFHFNIGAFLGFSVLMTLSLIFSKAIERVLPDARSVMAVIGCAYMLYQAYRCLFKKLADIASEEGTASIRSGFFLQFTNVKAILFGMTAMSNYIIPVWNSIFVQLFGAILLALLALICAVLWLAGGAVLGSFIRRYEKTVNLISAGLFVYCGIRLLL